MKVQVKKGILYFTAPWCGPCKQLGPKMEQLENSGIPIKKINTDYEATLVTQYAIKSVPTLVITDLDGNEIKRIQGGGKSLQQLKDWYNG
jgi:thioredoxin 1|tara:strand:+ start:361 stop:630 length:270 start_codon:yes stop_codon:yes gene_type:complete